MFKRILKGIRKVFAFIFLSLSIIWIIPTVIFFMPAVILYLISALFDYGKVGFKTIKAIIGEIKTIYK